MYSVIPPAPGVELAGLETGRGGVMILVGSGTLVRGGVIVGSGVVVGTGVPGDGVGVILPPGPGVDGLFLIHALTTSRAISRREIEKIRFIILPLE